MVRTVIRNVVFALAIAGASSVAITEPKVPSTPAEHMALAKQYQEKAASYRKEANDHRAMAESYRQSAANAQDRGRGQKNPFVVKMEKHCAALAGDAEKLAVDNEKAADFHTLRAKELQGK